MRQWIGRFPYNSRLLRGVGLGVVLCLCSSTLPFAPPPPAVVCGVRWLHCGPGISEATRRLGVAAMLPRASSSSSERSGSFYHAVVNESTRSLLPEHAARRALLSGACI